MLAAKVRLFLEQIDLSCLSIVPGTKRTEFGGVSQKQGARRVRPPADARRQGPLSFYFSCLSIIHAFLLFMFFCYSWYESTCLSMIPGTNRPVFRPCSEAVPQVRDARPPADARRPGNQETPLQSAVWQRTAKGSRAARTHREGSEGAVQAGLYCGSRLRQGEVFAYAGLPQNLKDLKASMRRAAVERIWHTQDSQGQILAWASRLKSSSCCVFVRKRFPKHGTLRARARRCSPPRSAVCLLFLIQIDRSFYDSRYKPTCPSHIPGTYSPVF
jgi:hypothetical protein